MAGQVRDGVRVTGRGEVGAEGARPLGSGVRVTGCGEVGAEGARQWWAGVNVTGRGWVWAEVARPEVGEQDAGIESSDAESSESGFGGRDLAGLAVKAGWGGCSSVSTLGATLKSKLKDLSLIRCFAVQPGSRLHLPVKVSARSDWGFRGEDGLPPLGCRHACHSPGLP